MLLYDMEISFRLYNCLTGAGLITTADVAAMSVAQLCNIPRLGTASMREIVDAFAALRLPMHPSWPQWIFDQRVSILSEGRDKDEVRRRLIATHGWPEEASERAAIVAWLRDQLDPCERMDERLVGLIDAIERGDLSQTGDEVMDQLCGPCASILCAQWGCQRMRGQLQIPPRSPAPHGCICPPAAEQTCNGPLCPRKRVGATT